MQVDWLWQLCHQNTDWFRLVNFMVSRHTAANNTLWKRLVGSGLVMIGLVFSGSAAVGASQPETVHSTNAVQAVNSQPVGALRNLVLAREVFNEYPGAVLGIDSAGTLWAYPSGPNGKLGQPQAIGTGFEGITLYPANGNNFIPHNNVYSTDELLGVNCKGEMRSYHLLFMGNRDTYSANGAKVGHGWSGFRVIPVGDLTGRQEPDVLAIKQSTGELFWYRYTGSGFKYPYPKVGQGWSNYQLLPTSDLTGAHQADVLGVSPGGNLYLYPGKGDGTFWQKRQIGYGWQGYDLISGTDVDGDGKTDIMSRDKTGRVFFYQGSGNGKFAPKVQVSQGWGPLDPGPDCSANPPDSGTMLPIPWGPTWIAFPL